MIKINESRVALLISAFTLLLGLMSYYFQYHYKPNRLLMRPLNLEYEGNKITLDLIFINSGSRTNSINVRTVGFMERPTKGITDSILKTFTLKPGESILERFETKSDVFAEMAKDSIMQRSIVLNIEIIEENGFMRSGGCEIGKLTFVNGVPATVLLEGVVRLHEKTSIEPPVAIVNYYDSIKRTKTTETLRFDGTKDKMYSPLNTVLTNQSSLHK